MSLVEAFVVAFKTQMWEDLIAVSHRVYCIGVNFRLNRKPEYLSIVVHNVYIIV